MKKLLRIFLALTTLLTLSLTAYADVIWEPIDDSFYEKHQDSFTYAGFHAYTNGESGETDFYAKPGKASVGVLENGLIIYIQHIYTDDSGKQWALITDDVYIPMDQLLNRYDNEFLEEHPQAFDTPSPTSFSIPQDAPLLLWTYPHGRYTAEQNHWGEDILSGMSAFYVDENGLIWGYIDYWYGHWNAWICLSNYNDPALAEPEHFLGQTHWTVDTDSAESKWASLTAAEPVEKKTLAETLLPILLPIGAAILAAVLLLSRPKRKS